MKTIVGIYYFIYIMFQGLLKEFIFRVISIPFFPIAYLLRWKIRDNLYTMDKELMEERVWKNSQDIGTSIFYSKVNKFYFFLWLFLDDSPAKDSITKVKHKTYNSSNTWDSSDTRRFYPSQFIYDSRILRDIWFSFFRNNSVNFVSWFRTAGWNTSAEVETFIGKYSLGIDKNDDNTKYIPGYYVALIEHNNGNKYPYFTYVGEIFGRKVGMWAGRSSGSGRFSFSIRA